jgi:hypothetical protein
MLEVSIAGLDDGRDGAACRTLEAFLRAGGRLVEREGSGIQAWWISTVEHVAYTVVECAIG